MIETKEYVAHDEGTLLALSLSLIWQACNLNNMGSTQYDHKNCRVFLDI